MLTIHSAALFITIEDLEATLDLLKELPDVNQDLYTQQAFLFTPFPTLPLELRQIIWTIALPKGQRVCLHPLRHHYNRPTPRRAPSVFHANQESRHIALKHYVIPSHHGTDRVKQEIEKEAEDPDFKNKFGELVRFFDPEADALYVDFQSLLDVGLMIWMGYMYFNEATQLRLGKICTLEIANVFWGPSIEVRMALDRFFKVHMVFKFLVGLKEIRLHCPPGCKHRQNGKVVFCPFDDVTDELKSAVAAHIKQLYDAENEKGWTLEMPKIVFIT